MTVVRTAYRYKRPPRKRQAVALEVPAVVKTADPAKISKQGRGLPSDNAPATTDEKKPAIVTIRSRKHAMLAHLLDDLTPEERQRSGDAADALFRAVVRRATGRKRP
jgi:hypothetical protein